MVVLFCTYLDKIKPSFRVEFAGVLWPEDVAGAAPEEIAAKINGWFEDAVRRYPDQYFWLHDRYRDTPLTDPGREASR